MSHVWGVATQPQQQAGRGEVEVLLRTEGQDLEWLPGTLDFQGEHSGVPVYASTQSKCPHEHVSWEEIPG